MIMTKCTHPHALPELIAQVDEHLQTLCYSEESRRHYRNVWNNLLRYAQGKKIGFFSNSLGRSFAEEHYKLIIGEPKRRTSFQRAIIRAIEVLDEYQTHGIVFRRRFVKDDRYPKQFAKYLD
jgi:hypothetical protein